LDDLRTLTEGLEEQLADLRSESEALDAKA